jgi:hypothetical protein
MKKIKEKKFIGLTVKEKKKEREISVILESGRSSVVCRYDVTMEISRTEH